jgi:3-oxoacyl-[acyl-carrier protein] reductase
MSKKSSLSIAGRAAVVTGGSRGIGLAIVERLLDEGVRVAFCATRQKSVDDAVNALAGRGEVYGIVADVSKREDAERLIADAQKRFGGPQILINNAAVAKMGSVGDLQPEDWERMVSVNLSGVYYCCHAVLPILRAAGDGDVINISSLAGKNPFAGGAAYNATKFGLNGFSEAMMLDHRNEGIRVSYVMPGSVDTAFGGGEAGGQKSAWKIAPEDIAEVVSTLLKMPRRTTVSRVEIRPSRPSK